MIFSPSIASRSRNLFLGALAAALVGALGSARPAPAAEVAPQISLQGGILLVSFAAPSFADEPSPGDFSCFVGSQAASGNFTCTAQGVPVSGRVVGVTDRFGAVVGHKVRMVREVGTTTESFEAALASTGDSTPYLWMAGSVERTTRTQSCSGVGTRRRCVSLSRVTGPFPFTGELFSISG
jgi:hypothetical protein